MSSNWGRTYWFDLGERTASTFLATFIPVYATVQNVAGLDWANALEISGTAAGLSFLKGLAANLKNSDSGPSLLPSPPAPDMNPEADVDAPPEGGW